MPTMSDEWYDAPERVPDHPLTILAALGAAEQSERDYWTERATLVLPTLCESATAESIGAMLRTIASDPVSLIDTALGVAQSAGVMLSAEQAHSLALGAILPSDPDPDALLFLAPPDSIGQAPERVPADPRAQYVSDTPSNLRGKRSKKLRATRSLAYLAHATTWHRDEMGHVRGWEITRSAAEMYGDALPALIGGDSLAFREVIHAGRSDDPYRVTDHHSRLTDALSEVAPEYREVVREACGDMPSLKRPASIGNLWRDSERVKRQARKGERITREVLSSWSTVTRVDSLPTYRLGARDPESGERPVYVMTGHGTWRLRSETVRKQSKSKRTAPIVVAPENLPERAESEAHNLRDRIGTIRIVSDDRTVSVSVSRGKTGRYTVRLRLKGSERQTRGNLRDPENVRTAVMRLSA